MSSWLSCAILMVVLVMSACIGAVAQARDVPVGSPVQLAAAMAQAQPGDRILLAAGQYDIAGNLDAAMAGNASAPIVVRAVQSRSVLLRFGGAGGTVEGFRVSAPHWQFEGLDIEGVCASDSSCEHAFHLYGDADFFVLRDSVLRNFNAQIKSNGSVVDGVTRFPDDAMIERNRLHDTRARQTAFPVTKIDVVGGQRWRVRDNVIEDFEKGEGDTISYAAFLKGNSSDGVFERNLVICTRNFSGGVRMGLSFGGGGTGAAFCEGGSCVTEHRRGTMRNNLILHCNDVGIYLNRAADTRLLHNTLYDTAGIDVRFSASSADIRNNLVSGAIRNRDGGSSTLAGNLANLGTSVFATWFVAPSDGDFSLLNGNALVNIGVPTPEVADDYCRNLRDDGAPDIGALEYDSTAICDTTRTELPSAAVLFADGFEGG